MFPSGLADKNPRAGVLTMDCYRSLRVLAYNCRSVGGVFPDDRLFARTECHAVPIYVLLPTDNWMIFNKSTEVMANHTRHQRCHRRLG
jgi:hypothetical protein